MGPLSICTKESQCTCPSGPQKLSEIDPEQTLASLDLEAPSKQFGSTGLDTQFKSTPDQAGTGESIGPGVDLDQQLEAGQPTTPMSLDLGSGYQEFGAIFQPLDLGHDVALGPDTNGVNQLVPEGFNIGQPDAPVSNSMASLPDTVQAQGLLDSLEFNSNG